MSGVLGWEYDYRLVPDRNHGNTRECLYGNDMMRFC